MCMCVLNGSFLYYALICVKGGCCGNCKCLYASAKTRESSVPCVCYIQMYKTPRLSFLQHVCLQCQTVHVEDGQGALSWPGSLLLGLPGDALMILKLLYSSLTALTTFQPLSSSTGSNEQPPAWKLIQKVQGHIYCQLGMHMLSKSCCNYHSPLALCSACVRINQYQYLPFSHVRKLVWKV